VSVTGKEDLLNSTRVNCAHVHVCKGQICNLPDCWPRGGAGCVGPGAVDGVPRALTVVDATWGAEFGGTAGDIKLGALFTAGVTLGGGAVGGSGDVDVRKGFKGAEGDVGIVGLKPDCIGFWAGGVGIVGSVKVRF